jgi:DNA-directed DNA polymerase III PolC
LLALTTTPAEASKPEVIIFARLAHPFYDASVNPTHLEVHSHFTLLGGTAGVNQLADRAAADGLSRLALTDTNALYGAVAFARACRQAGIQPIIGMTLTVAAPPDLASAGDPAPGHLVLLALNPTGYRSLCRLSSLIQGSPERETLATRGLTWDDLAANREGLICLSGGRRGWIARALRAGNRAAAQVYAGRLAGLFDDNAGLALEIHTAADHPIAGEVNALARRLGLPIVAVQPIYCLQPDDAPRLRLLAAIRENRPLAEITVAETPSHWLSTDELAARFAAFPAALSQTGEIAARCGDALPTGQTIWPALKLPAGQTPDEALARAAQAGLAERVLTADVIARSALRDEGIFAGVEDCFGPNNGPRNDAAEAVPRLAASVYQTRLDHELAAIAGHGYAPLFLVVADAVRFARSQGIPVSTRGSVANSLVAYCTGITTVDPIEHGLLFERFLNPARSDPPDIDLDFCSRRRDEVLRYLRDSYGAEHVALVGTVSTLRAQSAIRETGKAHGLPAAEIERLVALAPHHWHPDPRRRDKRTVEDVLAEIADDRQRAIVRLAFTLVGQPDHLSVHPGGVVIVPGPLTDVVPVQWAPKGFLITQFEHGDVEAIGLPKMDLLGIRALTVLSDTADAIRARDPGFRLDAISLADPVTGDLLARGETIGVFQCESDGAQRTLRKLKARTVRDLAIANAFFKPGPAMGGMADAFVRRYRGEARVAYLHPALEPILRDTKGVLIFQEQVLRVAREVAGLDWAQADQLRRGMGHFGAEQMAALREQFVAGCLCAPPAGPGFAPGQADTLWEQVMSFAGYGFNQGHATAYADVSFRSAYLKAHWPAEFLAARLADYGGFHHPVIYMAEAVRLGIVVRPPHVNFSNEAFTLANREIHKSANQQISGSANREFAILYMGLGQVRDLRHSAIEAIIGERGRQPFRSLADLLGRVELQAKEIMHLIQCGALDGLGARRAEMLGEAEPLRRAAKKGGVRSPALQLALPFDPPEDELAPSHREASHSETGQSMEARSETGQSMDARAARPAVSGAGQSGRSPELVRGGDARPFATLPAAEQAQQLAWETRILGLPVSALAHPLAAVSGAVPDHLPLRRLGETPGRPVTVAGVRLPGWTGGPGFFLADGDTFVIAKGEKSQRAPAAWRPLVVRGRWLSDNWGNAWLQADQITELPVMFDTG